jgi:hypothetical protein
MPLTEGTFQFTAECQIDDTDTLRVVNREEAFVFRAHTVAREITPEAEAYIHVSYEDAGSLARWLLFCLAETRRSEPTF